MEYKILEMKNDTAATPMTTTHNSDQTRVNVSVSVVHEFCASVTGLYCTLIVSFRMLIYLSVMHI